MPLSASFVIVTPAHNEEHSIESTIRSMIAQTVRPRTWVVVNDASTDHTRDIVVRYVAQHPFIRLVDVERPGRHSFANKARAFNHGLGLCVARDFEFVGNLDADISLDEDYFERLLHEFDIDPALGLGGGMVATRIGAAFVSQDVALDSVAGAVQLFRRQCFEQVGGYQALPRGGIDSAAEIVARMKGWKVRTFPELCVREHRRTGTATSGPLASKFREGQRLHSLGYGLLFMCLRSAYRAKASPQVIGSLASLCGYLQAMGSGSPVALAPEVVAFLRSEQRDKLRAFAHSMFERSAKTIHVRH